MQKIVCFIFSVFILISSYGSGDKYDKLFNEGVNHYKNEQYYEAIESFTNILSLNVENFETYYNLGNSYFKTNNISKAIYYYEKSLKIDPHNEDALHNLNYSKSLIINNVQELPEAFYVRFIDNIMKLFSVNGWAVFSIILVFLTVMFIVLFLLQDNFRLKRILFYFSIIFFIFTFSSISLANRAYRYSINPRHAIVISASTVVKSSPDKSSADIYVAQGGMKVKILSKLGEWYEVRVPDGNKGWINKETVKPI